LNLLPFAGGGALRIAEVTPGGAAAKAGISNGDIVDLGALSLHDRLVDNSSKPGYDVSYNVRRGHTQFKAVVHYAGEPASSPTWAIVLTVLADTAYLVLIFLLLRKAVDRLDGRLLLYILLAQIVNSVQFYNLTRDPVAYTVLSAISNVSVVFLYYALARFLANVPARNSPNTAVFERLTPWFALGFIAAMAYSDAVPFIPASVFVVFGLNTDALAVWGMDIAFLLLIVAIVGDGLTHTAKRERVQLQWIASTLTLLVLLELFRAIYYFASENFAGVPTLGWLDPITLPLEGLALLGAAYAVLRHRLIDMGLIVSRTAIFTAVSAVLVVLFLVLEWMGTLVAQRVLGDIGSAAAYSGIAAALVVGLLARPVHSALERRLNRVFFRKQAHNEEALRRFGRESEVATDSERLMDSAFATLSNHVEGSFVAILVREGRGFRCLNSTLPLSRGTIDENEPLALRLRRFGEPFELDEPGDEFHHAMFVPMTVLGRLIAFVVCGPKLDRTSYAEGETDALTQFAQRVGTAYVLLREKREIWVRAEIG
jgi:hypothetical protein